MQPTVLLLEARHDNPEHHAGVEYYLFLLGLCRTLGVETRWWVASVPKKSVRRGESYLLDVEPFQGAVLAELAASGPQCVVLNDRPSDALRAALEQAAPGARIVSLSGKVLFDSSTASVMSLLGLDPEAVPSPDAARLQERLLDFASPCFARRYFDPALESASVQFHPLAVRFDCLWLRKASSNRFYKHLDSDLVRHARGCAFCCLASGVEAHDVRRAGLERELNLVVAQIVAHQAEAGPHVGRFEYTVDQSMVGENIHLLLDRVIARGLRPCLFRAMLRPDSILAKRRLLENVLPRMAAHGHHLRLISIGVENLSAEENERLNKGVDAEQVFACDQVLEAWATRFPESFSAGPFSWILFTPWTRPADLRANLRGAIRLGRTSLRYMLGTMLLMWEGTPITELARHDGLVADDFGSTGDLALSCIEAAEVQEVPWRFQDPRVERIHALLMRIEPMPEAAQIGPDDPLLAEVRAARRKLPASLSSDIGALVLGVVNAVEALGAQAPVSEVFAHIAANLPELTAASEPHRAHQAAAAAQPREKGGPADRPRLAAVEVEPGRVLLSFDLPQRRRVIVEPRDESRPSFLCTEHLQFSYEGKGLPAKLKVIIAGLSRRWEGSTFAAVRQMCEPWTRPGSAG